MAVAAVAAVGGAAVVVTGTISGVPGTLSSAAGVVVVDFVAAGSVVVGGADWVAAVVVVESPGVHEVASQATHPLHSFIEAVHWLHQDRQLSGPLTGAGASCAPVSVTMASRIAARIICDVQWLRSDANKIKIASAPCGAPAVGISRFDSEVIVFEKLST